MHTWSASALFQTALVFMLLFGLQAQARTFHVTSTQDTTDVRSLRGAIIAANAHGQKSTIFLSEGTYRLSIPGADEDAAFTGDLDVSRGDLTIVGVGSNVTIAAAGLGDRVFHVLPGAQLTLCNVTITGGASSGGGNGGGIFNAGQLSLYHCIVRSNCTSTGVGGFVGGTGGHGAGIYNAGWLTLNHCTVTENFTAGGGGGGFDPNPGAPSGEGPGGNGGSGAGIYNAGILTLNHCMISRNSPGSGGIGGFATASQWGNAGGKGGDGGGIFNAGKLMLNRCTLSGNSTGAGGGGGWGNCFPIDDFWFYCTECGNGGNAGDGACIYNTGDLTLNTCTVSGNANGTGGVGGFGGGGNGGNGVIYNTGLLTMKSSTVTQNSGGEGGIGVGSFGDFGQGRGGDSGVVNATNGSLANLQDSLIAANIPGNGFGSIFCDGSGCWPPGPAPDLTGAFTSFGYNLIGRGDGSTGLTNGINGDLVGTGSTPINPLLGPLQDNGGPTPTHALLPGSPAIDQGKSFGLTTDQRGHHRPHDYASIPNAPGGDGSDIGAFELDTPILGIKRQGNGTVLSWDASCSGYTLDSTTDPTLSSGWTPVIGTPSIAGGQYQVTDSPAGGWRFYRLRSK